MTDERLATAVFKVEAISTDIAEIKIAMKEMATAVSKLAVIEERQVHDRAEIGRVFKQLGEHGTRISSLELAQPLQKQASDWVGKAVWAIVAAVATLGSSAMFDRVVDGRAPQIPHLTMPTK
jgi:23S rRNA pseudoU1915 N3-methylase RlmH